MVHFDRLKRCHPQTRLQTNTNSPSLVADIRPEPTHSQLPDSALFGTNLQFIEGADVTPEESPQLLQPEQSATQSPVQSPQPSQPRAHLPTKPQEPQNPEKVLPRRYPTRTRRPCAFFDAERELCRKMHLRMPKLN